MADKLSVEQRSANMARIRSKGSKPEKLVRSIAHQMGYRFRLHRTDLPGKPDLVFPKRSAVVFIHGCFWHRHPDPNCKDSRLPKSRLDYWVPKLERNVIRDRENLEKLARLGWHVHIIWECETKDTDLIGHRLRSFLDDQGTA